MLLYVVQSASSYRILLKRKKKKSKSGNIPAKLQNLVFGVEVCVWEEEKAVCQSPPTPRKK